MIRVENLFKKVEDEKGIKRLLNGISVNINDGEKVVIIGPSGAGKSTFLRCINLLESFSSGDILFRDKSILDFRPEELRQKIGMIFQHFNLFSHMTVKRNVTFAPVKLKLCSKREASSRAMELLKKVKLDNKAGVFPSRLSGGEKQRVAIARALAMNPEVLLVDEPTSALDPQTVSEVTSFFKSLSENITMIAVTHDMHFAKNLATRLIFMENGEIVEDGPVDVVFDSPDYPKIQSFFQQ